MFSRFSLLFFSSLDLSPVQMASAWVVTTFGVSQVEVDFPRAPDPPKGHLHGTDGLWDLWVRTIAYVERSFDGFLSVSFLSYSCTGLCSPGGLHLKRGIM